MKWHFSSRRSSLLGLFCALSLFGPGQVSNGQKPAADKPLLGFIGTNAVQQRALEAHFDALLKKENLRDWMKRLTARPHHLGSAYDKQNADFIALNFVPGDMTLKSKNSRSSFQLPNCGCWN